MNVDDQISQAITRVHDHIDARCNIANHYIEYRFDEYAYYCIAIDNWNSPEVKEMLESWDEVSAAAHAGFAEAARELGGMGSPYMQVETPTPREPRYEPMTYMEWYRNLAQEYNAL